MSRTPERPEAPELRASLHRGLDDLGCGALVILADSSPDPDLAPFVGPIHLGRAILVAPRRGELRLAFFTPMEREEAAATGLALLTPEALEIERLTRETGGGRSGLLAAVVVRALVAAGVEPGRVAVAGRGAAGPLHAACRTLERGGWPVVSGDELSLTLRKRKPPWQLAELRRVVAGTAAAFRRVAGLLAAAATSTGSGARDAGGDAGELWLGGERLTVGRLRDEIALALAASRLDQPEGNIVAPGAEGAVPHNTGTDERTLRIGETVVVDLFPRGGLLFADLTRTFCVGRPPAAVASAHAAILTALEGARAAARPGMRAWELQERTCQRMTAAGYPTTLSHPGTASGYVHNLGHGVGFELHEYPSFRRETGAEGLLAEGDVFTLEPGLYDPEAGFGVRVEDLLVLGPEGVEVLAPLPYDLDPRAWGGP